MADPFHIRSLQKASDDEHGALVVFLPELHKEAALRVKVQAVFQADQEEWRRAFDRRVEALLDWTEGWPQTARD